MNTRKLALTARASALALVVGLPAGQAVAADAEAGVAEVQELVVTARKRDEALIDVPFSVAAQSEQMMRDRGIGPPGVHYLETIRKGYRDFGLDQSYLDAALLASYADKVMSDQIIDRRERSERHRDLAPHPVKATVKQVVAKKQTVKAKPRKGIPAEQRAQQLERKYLTLEEVADKFHNPWGESRLIKKGEKQ